MYLKKDKFLIVGISASGIGATELLLRHGAKCYVYDDGQGETVLKNIESLVQKGAAAVGYEELPAAIESCDVVVLSPGVAIDHEIPVKAKRSGKRVIGELELAYMFCKAPIVAVTGTNGKTTTCTLIDCILKNAGIKSVACGNIGTPLSAVAESFDDDTVAVTEVSSFQLETVASFTPHISVVTNVSPDHLSRHYNMENYIFLKSRILANQRESEYAVLNHDDPVVRKFAEKTKAKTVFFSSESEVNGAYVSDGKIYYKGKYIADEADVPVGGKHNVMNVLAAVCVAGILGIDEEVTAGALRGFKGVRHRIQHIGTFCGVDYYNDSKATNPDATVKAIEFMKKPTVVILGGKDKGLSFAGLFDKIKRSCVKHAVLTGESAYSLFDGARSEGYANVSLTPDFAIAVRLASEIAVAGDAVLLSPACSSFDAFTDYAERGDRFVEIVNALYEEENTHDGDEENDG